MNRVMFAVCVVGVVGVGAGRPVVVAQTQDSQAPSSAAGGPAAPFPAARAKEGSGPVVRVGFDAGVWPRAVSGRLVVLMKLKGVLGDKAPLDGPFWEEEQPLFAVDVVGLEPGKWVEIGKAPSSAFAEPQAPSPATRAKGDGVDSFPRALSDLAPGEYEVQARLDTQRADSDWRREGGNLFSSKRAVLRIGAKGEAVSVDVKLDSVTKEPTREPVKGVEWFSVRSELLSKFRGHEVLMRAGVVLPEGYDAGGGKTYAAVYEVPGFGGNDEGAVGVASKRQLGAEVQRTGAVIDKSSPAAVVMGAVTTNAELARSTFWIVLDPEGPNGHTLFADSANNGPCGRALVEELIPALEKKYPLVAKREARLLRGHSSGGWSTLWLATEYPEVFGACWSSSPDPVDFRRFQMLDLYAMHWFYAIPSNGLRSFAAAEAEKVARTVPQGVMPLASEAGPRGGERFVSYRRDGKAVMTVEREARGEDLLGPDNTSGQQWDSWFAVWGPRNERGNPTALFDVETGLIDADVAKQYRKFDLADRLRKEPARYAPIFSERIRLVVGDADNFFLNEGVKLLKDDLDALPGAGSGKKGAGYIKIVPGLDHSSIFGSEELKGFEAEMVEYLKEVGFGK